MLLYISAYRHIYFEDRKTARLVFSESCIGLVVCRVKFGDRPSRGPQNGVGILSFHKEGSKGERRGVRTVEEVYL